MDGQITDSTETASPQAVATAPDPGNIRSYLNNEKGGPYDRKARLYEWLVSKRWYNRLAWGTTPADYSEFSDKAIGDHVGPYLDIGCGGLTHTATHYIHTERPVWLLDSSMAMLRQARLKLEKMAGIPSPLIRFIQADAFDLPFRAESFDTVASYGMLHLFDKKKEFLEEAMRVLRPGGRFYFSSMHTGRPFGKKYMQFLYRNREMGIPCRPSEILDLFGNRYDCLSSYIVGNMIFVRGVK